MHRVSSPHRVPPGSAAAVVDWAAAVRSARRFTPSGPAVDSVQAAGAVDDLRTFSRRAELIVRDTTGLGTGLPVADADVVDRPGWIAATAEGMARLTAPLTDRLAPKVTPIGRTAAGTQIGMVLGFLAGRVLGQFDPLLDPRGEQTRTEAKGSEDRSLGARDERGGEARSDPRAEQTRTEAKGSEDRSLGARDERGGEARSDPRAEQTSTGRLLLVAPNIVKVERELRVDPADFRMWVCLHESTHRLQFTAVPWLRNHFVGQVGEFGAAADIDAREIIGRMVRAIRGRHPDSGLSWIESVQTPAQRAVFDRLMALMSLLEGHADHVMDAVGPRVVPSVTTIRSAFTDRRRKGRGPIDRLLRSLLGMDMKMSQYIKGEAFVSQVVSEAGMEGFNTVWSSPRTLPSRDEINNPEAWMARVLR